MALSSGARLGRYEILAAIGAGGMGEVYKARDTRLDRTVAIKILPPEVAGDPERRRRFEQEARAVAALNHPHICTLHDIGREGDTDFLVMEYVEGETLAERMRGGPLPVDEVVQVGLQLADALGSAHERGLIHRDIKPSNLMATPGGLLKILDFGLAKRREPVNDQVTTQLVGETWSGTVSGAFVGTPAYMAPEQITGDPVSPPTDVYGAGCVLYELLAGCSPFAGANIAEVLRRSLTETPRPLTELCPEVPAKLSAVVARALARDPHQRYANGRELARALREAAVDTPAGEAAAPGTRDQARGTSDSVVAPGFSPAVSWAVAKDVSPATRRPRLLRLAAAVAGAAGLLVLAWFVVNRFTEPALAFKERDFGLVADVVNATGEPVFDLALKSALETDLRQSRYVNVLDSSQVQNALLLMRQKPDTGLSLEMGREVCRRLGARALLVPRILRAGQAYQLQVSLIEPATGRVAGEVQVTARGREQVLLSGIDQLTRELRKRLGESLASIARTDPPFAQYTTSSLEALQLLVLGQRAWDAGDFAKAERSFTEALQHDPRFAAARASIGLLYIQFMNRADEGRTLLAEALREEGSVSQREYLALRALNKQFVATDLRGALDDYRFISELYPDFMPPYNNSGRILIQLGRYREAATMFERANRADPRSGVPLWNLWFLSVRALKDPPLAERAARDLIGLFPGSANAEHALAWSFVTERRFPEAEDGMRRALKIDPSHAFARPNLAHLLFRRGAWKEAIGIYRDVIKQAAEGRSEGGTEHVQLCLGLSLLAAGETAEAQRTFIKAAETVRRRASKAPLSAEDQATLTGLLAAAGRRDEARALAARLARAADRAGDVNYGIAQAWALLGDPAQAISCLEHAFAAGYGDSYFILIDPPFATLQADPALERLAPRRANPSS